jgi:hypothetical protein
MRTPSIWDSTAVEVRCRMRVTISAAGIMAYEFLGKVLRRTKVIAFAGKIRHRKN